MTGASPGLPRTMDDVADALAQHLLDSMPEGGLYGRSALARLPEPVEHVLRAALERRVAREASLPETPWLDADDPALRDAARAWREAAREAARYPAGDWPRALREAAAQALHHLVDPGEAAADFCFAGERGALPFATVRARMAAFGPYPYLREIAGRYAERKDLDTVDEPGLEALLHRIDRRMTAAFGAVEWDALASPLFGLVGSLPGMDGRVPTDLLRRFFGARGADALADAVAGQDAWSAAELHDLLLTTLAMPSQPTDTETVDLALVAATTAPPAPADQPATQTPPRALWESLAPAGAASPEPPAPAEPLWQALARSSGAAGPAARPETLASLEARVLGDGALAQRDVFIGHVAGGSEAAYRRLLEALDAAAGWDDAWPVIAAAFRDNGVDIYGAPAVAFTDAAEARFGR